MQVARVDAAREVEMKIVDLSHTIETLPEDVPSRADLPYSQIERLTNLGALAATGFTVACFPLKIKRASAGLARVVAILDS
jgi:kynurenine formamidase